MKSFKNLVTYRNIDDFFRNLDRDTLLIYSPTSLAIVNEKNTKVHMIDARVFGRSAELMKAFEKMSVNYKQIVSLGGGTATDAAKYVASQMGVKFVCIVPMLSTNSYSTNKVSLVVNGKKETLDAKMADVIVCDPTYIAKAGNQNLYGIADILSIYTALLDWKLADENNKESIDNYIYDEAEKLLDDTLKFVSQTDYLMSEEAIMKLFGYVGYSGHITNVYGCGRPESGSEHIIARDIENIISVPHGISVSVGIILSSLMHNNISEPVVECIKKIGTLNNLDEYGITEDFLKKILTNLKPRVDRYSIIDKVSMTESYIDSLIDNYKKIIE